MLRILALLILIVAFFASVATNTSGSDASIAFDEESYCRDERRVIITVIDPQMNVTYNIDEVNGRVSSSTDTHGMVITFRETGPDTGIFQSDVRFIGDASAGVGLWVEEGDTIFAMYKNVTATATVSRTPVEPIKTIHVNNAKVYDAFDSSLLGITVRGPKIIQADLGNRYCYNSQAFSYIVQIKNEDGYTVFLSWIKSTLGRDQSSETAIQWMPKITGNYTVGIFVWDSLINPQPLSEKSTMEVRIT